MIILEIQSNGGKYTRMEIGGGGGGGGQAELGALVNLLYIYIYIIVKRAKASMATFLQFHFQGSL